MVVEEIGDFLVEGDEAVTAVEGWDIVGVGKAAAQAIGLSE